MTNDKPNTHGGQREGAGRKTKSKSGEKRTQKSISLTPRAWLFIAQLQEQYPPGTSESDVIEKLIRSHLLYKD